MNEFLAFKSSCFLASILCSRVEKQSSCKMGGKRIFDFQGFNLDDGSFILKEITIVDIYADKILHYLILPPFDINFLSDKELRRVLFLQNYHHKISWVDGLLEYGEIFHIIRKAVRDADILYVKGSERAAFLRKITGKLVIDLDQLECPKASCLPDIAGNVTCHYKTHSRVDGENDGNGGGGVCSLVQALKFKSWLRDLFEKPEDEVDFAQ